MNREYEDEVLGKAYQDFQREIHQKLLIQMGADERKKVISYLEVLRSAMEAVKEQLV